MNRFWLKKIFGAILVVLFSGSGSMAQGQGSERAMLNPEKKSLRVAYVSAAGAYVGLWVAVEKGYFADYGLRVEPIFTRTISGMQALIAGNVEFINCACPQLMSATKAGSGVTMLAAFVPFNLYMIASQPNIKDPKQLVGKRVAINQIGDTTHLTVRFALEEVGVDPDKVTYVQIGGTPARLAALKSKSVEGALQSAQSMPAIRRLGMNVLINLLERKLPYCGTAIGALRPFIKENPQTTEAFMRGIVKGNAFAHEGNPSDVKQIMAKYMKSDAKDQNVIDAYNFYPKTALQKHPDLPIKGLTFIINESSISDPSWKKWKPEQFFDSTILDRLRKEGFLEKVYSQIQ
jgi:ABC-type nitrate/sulfonate/bicarbonate transport system substrate-binding protein